ncbi:hypothetical protein LZC95_06405 [Pendulispora brunnea]|uniref:Uncharacterized protein n=1 Tax=Pendulispora brunnea TaxID=2905690 RepID=A0ABZ2KHD2_9BACT
MTSAEYKFPAAMDPDVESTQATELWAQVYRPENLGDSAHPVLVFLHGNHATCGIGTNPRKDNSCDYTRTGTCPSGYVVTPNHLGYAYVAERLASHGYVVVSINANRGINCRNDGPSATDPYLNFARGRLVLKHLQKLSEWNANGGTPASLGVELQGKLDFSQIGLMGHSRGGEGIRAAYNLYREANSTWPTKILSPVSFRALFEIGPVDGQLPNTTPPFPRLNADGTVWSVLLPMCDGDVYNLQGVLPYDRMLRIPTETPAAQKSTFTVWGANHNFYNTEWQEVDGTSSPTDQNDCVGHAKLWEIGAIGSESQRATGLVGMMGLFRANVGPNADPKYNQVFNPMFALPPLVKNIDRGYTDSSSSVVTTTIEDFTQPAGKNSHGTANEQNGIDPIVHGTVPNHADAQKAGRISWQSASADAFFQTNWSVAGEGQDISSYKTLDLRISRQYNETLNVAEQTSLSVQLALADGSVSNSVSLNSYTVLRGPVGGKRGGRHPILQSVRIPLADFGNVDLTKVRGVRFVFNETASGAIYLGNVSLSNILTVASTPPTLASSGAPSGTTPGGTTSMVSHYTKGNSIKSIRHVQAPGNGAVDETRTIEIELETAENFPVRDAIPTLRIGDREFGASRHPNGDTRRIVFILPEADFAAAKNGENVTVHYGDYEHEAHWVFGKLDKRALR